MSIICHYNIVKNITYTNSYQPIYNKKQQPLQSAFNCSTIAFERSSPLAEASWNMAKACQFFFWGGQFLRKVRDFWMKTNENKLWWLRFPRWVLLDGFVGWSIICCVAGSHRGAVTFGCHTFLPKASGLVIVLRYTIASQKCQGH